MTTTLGKSGLSATAKAGGVSRRLRTLLMAPPKTGKTVIAHCFPRTRTLDFDDGMQSVEWAVKAGIIKRDLNDIVYETVYHPGNPKKQKRNALEIAEAQVNEWIKEEDIPAKDWDEYCRTTHDLEFAYSQKWDTLIIDSETFLKEAAIILGMQQASALNLSKSWSNYKGGILDAHAMTYPDWGAASKLIWKFNEWACTGLGKNVVATVHQYMNTDDSGSLISIDPNTIGQLRQQLPALYEEFWGLEVTGTRENPKFKIQTAPGNKMALGSRLGCLPNRMDADFDAIKTSVADFYGVDKDWLWTAYHGEAGAARAAEEAEEAEGASI